MKQKHHRYIRVDTFKNLLIHLGVVSKTSKHQISKHRRKKVLHKFRKLQSLILVKSTSLSFANWFILKIAAFCVQSRLASFIFLKAFPFLISCREKKTATACKQKGVYTFCSRFPLVLAAENDDDGDDFLPCCVVDFHNSLGHHQDVSCNAAFTSLFIDQTEALLLQKPRSNHHHHQP